MIYQVYTVFFLHFVYTGPLPGRIRATGVVASSSRYTQNCISIYVNNCIYVKNAHEIFFNFLQKVE